MVVKEKALEGVGDERRIGPKRAPQERFHVFADESATDAQYPCYGIGALIVPESRLARFNQHVARKLTEHGIVGEARWKKIDASHGLINFAIEAWRDVVGHPSVRFAMIVVNKSPYRKWSENKEEAFYVTFTFLLRHAAKLRPGDFDVVIDNRSDSYAKQDEVLGIVSNHMLRSLNCDSENSATVATIARRRHQPAGAFSPRSTTRRPSGPSRRAARQAAAPALCSPTTRRCCSTRSVPSY